MEHSNAPIARICDANDCGNCYPFLALADPSGDVASKFKADHHVNPLALFYSFVRGVPEINRIFGTCNPIPVSLLPETVRAYTFIPSELLIDENGILVDMLTAHTLYETMNFKRISHFLLYGTKFPGETGDGAGKTGINEGRCDDGVSNAGEKPAWRPLTNEQDQKAKDAKTKNEAEEAEG